MAVADKSIFNFKIGAVVLQENYFSFSYGIIRMYGHVVGFGLNSCEEVTIHVKWANQETSAVHPANLTLSQPE